MKSINERKVIQILMGFPEEVIAEFKSYLGSYLSPYKKLEYVLAILETHVFLENSPPLTPERYYELAFSKPVDKSNSKQTGRTINTQLSKLMDAFYKFLAIRGLQKDQNAQLPFIISEFSAGNPRYSGEKLQKDLYKRMELTQTPNAEHYLTSHLSLALLVRQIQSSSEKFDDDHWLNLSKNLEYFYSIQKFEIGCAIWLYNERENANVPTSSLLPFPEFDASTLDSAPVILKAGYHAFHLYTAPSPSHHYQQLKQIVFDFDFHATSSEYSDLQAFFFHLNNHCMMRLNHGDLEIQQEADQLFDFGLEMELISPKEGILYSLLKNILTTKCRLGKVEEAESIFQQFKSSIIDKVEKNRKEDLLSAIIEFYKGHLNKAINMLWHLGQEKFQEMPIELDRRIFDVICRIERNQEQDYDLLETQFATFEKYLSRRKDSSLSMRYLKFLRMIKKYHALARVNHSTKAEFQSLLDKVHGMAIPNKQLVIDLISKKIP